MSNIMYDHPHISDKVIDNSANNVENTIELDNLVRVLNVFTSEKGRHNKLLPILQNKVTGVYGKVDFAKYGQPYLNAVTSNAQNNVLNYCMRVMPPDAAIANSVLLVGRKVNGTKLSFKYGLATLPSQTDFNSLVEAARVFDTTPLTVEGQIFHGFTDVKAIAVVYGAGAGKYYNGLKWRITPNFEYEKTTSIKMFTFQILDDNNSVANTFIAGVATPTRYNTTTLINEVILSKFETSELEACIHVFEDVTTELYEALKTFVAGLDAEDRKPIPNKIDEFDPFFAYEPRTNPSTPVQIGNLEIDTADVSVSSPTGSQLLNGSEGSFENANPTVVAEAISTAYAKAFMGTADKLILSLARTPVDIILDANYPTTDVVIDGKTTNAKKELISLMQFHRAKYQVIDAGVDVRLSSIETLVSNSLYDIGSNVLSAYIDKDCFWQTIIDPYTNRRIKVTVTYLYSSLLPVFAFTNMNKPGTEFKGYNCRLILSNPSLECGPILEDGIDSEYKELLYDNRWNYMEPFSEREYRRADNITAQTLDSALLVSNNTTTLSAYMRIVRKVLSANLIDLKSVVSRNSILNIIKAKVDSELVSSIESLDHRFEVTAVSASKRSIKYISNVSFPLQFNKAEIEINVERNMNY